MVRIDLATGKPIDDKPPRKMTAMIDYPDFMEKYGPMQNVTDSDGHVKIVFYQENELEMSIVYTAMSNCVWTVFSDAEENVYIVPGLRGYLDAFCTMQGYMITANPWETDNMRITTTYNEFVFKAHPD
jgi:hypothetical protein